MTKSKTEIVHQVPPAPIFASLRERLEAGREAAGAAWAAKASAGWRETIVALNTAVRAFEVRSPEVLHDEDLLRLRSELAEMLRSAASAIAPRAN